MGLFLFIDGPPLVCEWVNFFNSVASHPHTNKAEVTPPPKEGKSNLLLTDINIKSGALFTGYTRLLDGMEYSC